MKALEINSNLKEIYQSPMAEEEWKKEKAQLVSIIKTKNKEIKHFRHELDSLLSNLAELRGLKK